MARFALVERPAASPEPQRPMTLLREVAGRLQGQVKQTTRATNQLHNLLARTFPELATLADDITAGWVLRPARDATPPPSASPRPTSPRWRRSPIWTATRPGPFSRPPASRWPRSAGRWPRRWSATSSSRSFAASGRSGISQRLLAEAWDDLPASPHVRVLTIPGIGKATAAVLVAKIVDIDRFATPEQPGQLLRHLPGGGEFRGREGGSAPAHRARCPCRARGTTWSAPTSGTRPGRPSSTTRPSGPSIAASGPRGSAATSRSGTACASCCTWPSPSGRPIAPSTRGTTPGSRRGRGPRPRRRARRPRPRPRGPAGGTGDEDAVGHKQDEPAGKVVTTAAPTVEPVVAGCQSGAALDPGRSSAGGLRIPARTDHAWNGCSRIWACCRSSAAGVGNVAAPARCTATPGRRSARSR